MTPAYLDQWLTVYQGDCRDVMRQMDAESIHTVVTSPPYWGLRDYGVSGQLGLEPTPEEYVENMVAVFREVRRVLRSDGTVWLNLGDSYAANGGARSYGSSDGLVGRADAPMVERRAPNGLKPKDRVMIPARVALALQADGWWLRDEIVWSKPNPMPSSVRDRTTPAHEMVYLLSKSARYFYDGEAIKEPMAESSVQRISQPTFDSQTGGPKDYANGTNPNQSARKALENIARPRRKPAGWNVDHVESNLVGRYKHGKQADIAANASPSTGRTMGGFNERWESAEDDGLAPMTRNKRSVWSVPSQAYPDAHFATFPEKLIEPMILAGAPDLGVVLDPFGGSGTTARVAQRLGRRAVLIDLNPEYIKQQFERNRDIPLGLEVA